MLYLSLRCGTGNENKQNEAGFDPFFNKTVIISQNCNFLLHVSPLLGHVLALGNPEVPASEEPLGRHVDHVVAVWVITGLFFIIFVFSIQMPVNVQYEFLPMTGFEPRTSGVWHNHSQKSTLVYALSLSLSLSLFRLERGGGNCWEK